MKPTIKLIFLGAFLCGFWSCNSETESNIDENSIDTLDQALQEETMETSIDELDEESADNELNPEDQFDDYPHPEDVYENYKSSPELTDDLFKEIKIERKKITGSDFIRHIENYTPTCAIEMTQEMIPGQFIKGKGIKIDYYSDPPACQTSILDEKARVRMVLPSRYDDGFIITRFSPSCNQIMTFFQFEFNDYNESEEYGAELYGYKLTSGSGIETIKPSFRYYSKDWLINDLVWINENSVAVQTFKDHISSMKMDDYDNFEYFELTLGK